MKLSEIQHEQSVWQDWNFPGSTEQEAFEGIVEEVGELAHARLKLRQGIRTNENHLEAEQDALGDVVIYLLAYCNYRGYNLEQLIDDTWLKVSKRDWRANPADANKVAEEICEL
jgi:NTP pyrophosphatase (non-canonical NTP hydrolase)